MFNLSISIMKKLVLVLSLMVCLVFKGQTQVKQANLRASGLTCAMCSKAIYKSLTAIPFVEKVNVDIQKSTYDIQFKPGSEVDFDALGRAVIDAGFSVASLDVTTNLQDVKVKKGSKVTWGNYVLQFVNVPDQTLSGEKIIKLIDKNFVSKEAYKKYALAGINSYKTGFDNGKRIYHVTL